MKKRIEAELISIAHRILKLKNKSEVDQLYKETQKLSRTERKELGIPPNAFYEQKWELTMDPSTGQPMPERVRDLQNELRDESNPQRGVGGDAAL